ncbi:hypothetical protein SAMD00023353_5500180 [Rosellinia necatrix]|uniref:2EXR domain-containing protein n=1 Tax=Rosellinia necatrix TaxID=77044 RepID=A0A1W2TQW1_ROSNE|nr:hypothetical protein SAMD00023353_5500180 [Rosellinia necatrix]
MSDRSDCEDDPSSDAADISVGEGSDESETDQGDHFFDLEAEDSDGHGEDDASDEDEESDEDDEDDDGDDGEHYSFPQFSRLPPELRAMIWEAVDPYFDCNARVLEFEAQRGGIEITPCMTMEQQIAPARTLLSVNKESRHIALVKYPDAIRVRDGEVRFNSSNDIILIRRLCQDVDGPTLAYWCHKIKYLAIYIVGGELMDPVDFPVILGGDLGDHVNLETVYYCMDSCNFSHSALGWSVANGHSKQFFKEFDEASLLGSEVYSWLYGWSTGAIPANQVGEIIEHYVPGFCDRARISSIPIQPMVEYADGEGIALYQKAKRYYERNHDREGTPIESEEGESFSESERDDYSLDSFVVDGSSEGGGGTTDDEDEGVNVHDPHNLSDPEYPSDEGTDEEAPQFNHDPDNFNGFSPLQDPSDDEIAGSSPIAAAATQGIGSLGADESDASSVESQPQTTKQPYRHKRRIVSSENGDDSEEGGVSTVEPRSRVKRTRLAISDSEDEGVSGNSAGSGVEVAPRLKKRARVILSESEDGEDEGQSHGEGGRLPAHDSETEDEDEETEETEETEEEDDEGDEEAETSKPMSLLTRLRQFRSDVPVSPERGSTNSAEEYDEEERYGDDEEQGFFDAEFPESAGENDEGDGW